jgi:hypothetical protein
MIEVRAEVKLIMIANDDYDIRFLLFNPMYPCDLLADVMPV